MDTKPALMLTLLALLVVALLSIGALDLRDLGRYQLVAMHEGVMYMANTATGRVWRYTRLTNEKRENISPCMVFQACFLEVDRMHYTALGWISEVYRK